MIAYYKLFGDIPDGDYESCVAFLEQELRYALTAAYEEEFSDAEVRHFNDAARRLYTLFFDCTEDCESDDIYSRAARVVFVYGRSSAGTKDRDSKRMRAFLGAFKNQPEYVGYDKGHFIAHCNDGQIDQNLYPQLKELNRGLSAQGKLFRSMERYLQRNEGVFYFVRPIYSDLTWIPHQIDFGIFTKEKGLLLNRFDNRKPGDAI
ncbi:DNA/RNA non-specific endonuclease [Mucilaginibacter sp.]|uniref:DNA/RNA non-specific endonuclease n=1 Tax=Mucilaginibacter sp. TaxID=1882438 RepID=UPI003266DD93